MFRYIFRTVRDMIRLPPPVEQFETVNGRNICYVRVGHGPHNVLCIPGFLGVWWHFHYQYRGLDPEKFTIIVADPPGYGKSLPLDRNKTRQPDVLHDDARIFHGLMSQLHLVPYSILGWSDGANTALLLAHQQRHCNNIRRLVLWGGNAYVCADMQSYFNYCRDIRTTWGKELIDDIQLWTTLDYAQQLFDESHQSYQRLLDNKMDIIPKDVLENVKNETLLIHGAKDWVTPTDHAYYISRHLQNSRLMVHPEADHYINITEWVWFNPIVERFLTSEKGIEPEESKL